MRVKLSQEHPFPIFFWGGCRPVPYIRSDGLPILPGSAAGAAALKYESVEKALFRCIQKSDESNDSFLARTDIYWTELLAKKTSLEEIRAYVVLRGSLLTQDDKKRVILESDASGSGQLDMTKVNQSVRMLGSGLFHEMTGVKESRGKTYDASALNIDDSEEFDQPTLAAEDLGEDEMLEVLLQEGDEDAVFISPIMKQR